MGGDKIVLLDGAGANGGGAATNGLLSMIPGMFANLIGGNRYDEIEDRRGGGRGRSRRSDGTYMEYGHGFLPPYDHYGMHEKMKEMEERENELEERERRLEERERRHEMEDREYRRMGYESYPTDYYGDDRYYGDGPQMRRGRGRGRGRSY